MNIIEQFILKLKFSVWARLKVNIYPSFHLSHSQFGEDMVIRALTNDATKGFYIDIGAHHPIFISNTYHFYSKGWRGINIDASPGSMEFFNILRPKDINLEICISPVENKEVTFYRFENSPLNTLDPAMAEIALSHGTKLIDKIKLKTMTLNQCLDMYVPHGTEIDLMSIDVEGIDEAILMSNDWNRYRPKILVFEKHEDNIKKIDTLPLMQYLAQFNYKLVAKCGPSVILKLEN